MLSARPVALFIACLQFAARRCALLIHAARDFFTDGAFERMTTWRWLIGARHATVKIVDLFSEPIRQSGSSGFGPIERYPECGAARTTIQAGIFLNSFRHGEVRSNSSAFIVA